MSSDKRFSRVHIREEKITQYLLNEEHPEGKGKARFFIATGFSPDSPGKLSDALFNHPKTAELEREQTTEWGTKRVFVCDIKTPKGKSVCIISVWQIDEQMTTLRLITAYPNDKTKK